MALKTGFLNKVHCTPYNNAGNAWLTRMVLWREQVYFNPDFIISAVVVRSRAEYVGVIDTWNGTWKCVISSLNFERKNLHGKMSTLWSERVVGDSAELFKFCF